MKFAIRSANSLSAPAPVATAYEVLEPIAPSNEWSTKRRRREFANLVRWTRAGSTLRLPTAASTYVQRWTPYRPFSNRQGANFGAIFLNQRSDISS